ncbi:MAG: aminopeptidase P family protein [Dehalococcoidales bacterium]|nr:aminopeptidase P family protein [Dehalococcoidales bacterium]
MSLETRRERLRQQFAEKEIDGLLVSQPANVRYLSGFDGSAGYLLITAQDAILATDFRYLAQAARQAPGFQVFRTSGAIDNWFPELTSGLKVKQLGFEAGHVTFSLYGKLSGILSKARLPLRLTPVEGLVETLRAIKEPEEIELITRAAAISGAAFEYAETIIRPGASEQEIAWEIERFMRERGSEALPFEVIVASGPNSALPHAKPSPRKLAPGEPVVIDIGARVSGYGSDLSRTVCPGDADEQFNRVYDTVLGAQLAAIAMIREGMSGEEADRIARIIIEEAGYKEAFGHALGHGIGLNPHEAPRLGPNAAEPLASGMVFTIEPGIYLDGWGGVRIEDTVVLENDKIRVISSSRKVGK